MEIEVQKARGWRGCRGKIERGDGEERENRNGDDSPGRENHRRLLSPTVPPFLLIR
jgi:hypothetical protein